MQQHHAGVEGGAEADGHVRREPEVAVRRAADQPPGVRRLASGRRVDVQVSARAAGQHQASSLHPVLARRMAIWIERERQARNGDPGHSASLGSRPAAVNGPARSDGRRAG